MVVAMNSAGANVGDWKVGFNRPVARNITSLVDVRFWAETDTPCVMDRVKKKGWGVRSFAKLEGGDQNLN